MGNILGSFSVEEPRVSQNMLGPKVPRPYRGMALHNHTIAGSRYNMEFDSYIGFFVWIRLVFCFLLVSVDVCL